MPKIWTGLEPRIEYLRRLSVVFAVDLRIKILTELYQREMSPKQFFAEHGGGSLSRVDKNFKKLEKHGWLRYLRSETGGSRRGARENFYRATGLAFIDSETWALVPYSMRVAFSWRTFRLFAERVHAAFAARTFTARAGSDFACETFALDQAGWDRVIAAIDALFGALFEEQEDALLRIAHSGETPMAATVGLVGFESAQSSKGTHTEGAGPCLVPVQAEPLAPFMSRVSKVFADELCLKIVAEANRREISAPLFHAECGGESLEGIRRRFKKAESAGWLKQVNQKTGGRRRSAVELFYRATGPAVDDGGPWRTPPGSTATSAEWNAFEELTKEVIAAIAAGTLEARTDDHLSWSALRLDEQGWLKVTGEIETARKLIRKEQEAAAARLARSGEDPIVTTIALAAFESPKESKREP
ncbi:MAG TPA: winged helix-turn-helix domain-containing protein [Solirubrobacterales bacterium]|nr:winged helix-turn-helix domain-containing protein [Solirubrobacterales bacterium]